MHCSTSVLPNLSVSLFLVFDPGRPSSSSPTLAYLYLGPRYLCTLRRLTESMWSTPVFPSDTPRVRHTFPGPLTPFSPDQSFLIPVVRIVASLVRARPVDFFWNILRWLLVAIPATWTNSWLSYIQNKLAIAYRTRLTKEVMKQYLGEEPEAPHGKVYYKLCMYSKILSLS